MLQIERRLVNAESSFAANEVEYRKLEQLQAQFDAFNVQGTLIVGCVFMTLNADNLVALMDDLGKFCMYKRPALTHLYLILTLAATGLCMCSVLHSMYIVYRSQRSANDVSVRLTVALVRTVKTRVLVTYFIGMASFFVSFLVLCFIYFAQDNWIPLKTIDGHDVGRPFIKGKMLTASGNQHCKRGYPNAQTGFPSSVGGPFTGDPTCDNWMANGMMVPVVTTDTGNILTSCLNPAYTGDLELQKVEGVTLATSGILSFVGVAIYLVVTLLRTRREFDRLSNVVTRPMPSEMFKT